MENNTLHSVPTFGYELIRDRVLSSILGKHEKAILYWAGKDLARNFPLNSIDEMITFFADAGWGELTLVKENKDERLLELHFGDMDVPMEIRCYRLEAGFLAAQFERLCGFLTECFEEKNKKKKIIQFKLKTDLKEPVK